MVVLHEDIFQENQSISQMKQRQALNGPPHEKICIPLLTYCKFRNFHKGLVKVQNLQNP